VSSAKAHWSRRKPGQPFFAVFNSTRSHESQVRRRPHKAVHDPATVACARLSPRHARGPARTGPSTTTRSARPTPTRAKRAEGARGGAGWPARRSSSITPTTGPGLPRKQALAVQLGTASAAGGLQSPRRFKHLRPPEYRAGGKSDRLVSFVDFAPTVLSLAGVKPPDWMQGHAFLGAYQKAPSTLRLRLPRPDG